MKLKPLGHRVLVKIEQVKTSGGIILPGDSEEMQKRGTIVEVSDSVTDLKVGDKVVFENYGVDVGDCRLIPVNYIMGVIE